MKMQNELSISGSNNIAPYGDCTPLWGESELQNL
jgi:hypothetical protein